MIIIKVFYCTCSVSWCIKETVTTRKMGGMEIFKINVAYILCAQDRDRWRALVKAVMNLRVPQNAGNFLSS